MGIDAKRFGLVDCIGKVVSEVPLFDGNGIELSLRQRGHFTGDGALVVVGALEGEGEGANGLRMMTRSEAEDSA